MARKVTETDIYDSEGNFLFTQTLTSYTDDEIMYDYDLGETFVVGSYPEDY